MNTESENIYEENTDSLQIIETVELMVEPLTQGTFISCSDKDGFDQNPSPVIRTYNDNYYIDTIEIDGRERIQAYWKTYNTLEFYNEEVKAGKAYTIFGVVRSKPGYIFNDPVNLIVNGEEVSSEEVEDYSLEQDSFTFYFDVEAVE